MFGHKFPYSKDVPWIGAYYTKQLKNILSYLIVITLLFGLAPTEVDMPIVPELQEVFDNIPTPVSKDQPYFKGYEKDKVSKAIKKIFTSAGLDGYGAKSLRRYVGEEINSQYMLEADKAVKMALSHSKTSKADCSIYTPTSSRSEDIDEQFGG